MRHTTLFLAVFAVLVSGLLASPLAVRAQDDRSTAEPAAQEVAPSPLPGVFGEVLDVRVINLEVVVTDKQETQVLGLGADDFKLMVDGADVPIDYFSEIRGGVALEAPAPGAGEAKGLPGVLSVTPGEAVGTSYLVFIDDFFAIKTDRDAVLRSLKDDLPYLKPEDRMAIVAYDGKDLEMLSSWSGLQRPLERAIDDAMGRRSQGLLRLAERKRYDFLTFDGLEFLSDDLQVGSSIFRTELTPEERTYVELVTEQVNRSVAAASATLRSFAKPPGRKVMIILSGGWPFVPADFLLSDASRILFDRGGPYGNNLYRRLVETANVLGYTLYPVDLPGLDRQITDITRAEFSNVPEPGTVETSGFLREVEVHSTLRYLAKETGGEARINSQRMGALERVSDDVQSYYWLGFTPQRERDDASHEVEIQLRNPDFIARSRGSFLDSSREREVSMAVESTLLFGNAAAAGSVDVEVGTPVDAVKRRMEIPIKVSIPLDQVTILPIGDRFATELELRVAVQDEDGQQAPIPVIPWRLAFAEMPPAGAVGTYETTLLLRRKIHDAVVAVHDPASGRIFATGFGITPVDR
ncbi:MAG: VWA domain-containing protein [bacterium]|nr:VWA domain-containing protein [bacterium]